MFVCNNYKHRFKTIVDPYLNRKMDKKDKNDKKRTNDTERDESENKADKMTLGDELLEKEFERQKIAKNLSAKHKLGKDKSKQN